LNFNINLAIFIRLLLLNRALDAVHSSAMIPLHLTLKNFLSYREATLDFRGLHTACICGANGAGKSSLLEAIAWAVWGESRVAVEDDIIHLGQSEAQVDFMFACNQQTYRIIRTRQRGQGTVLEFQIARGERSANSQPENSPLSFRPLTEKSVRTTQQRIQQHLKLDYDTFVNSAYLRQGRADEFMLRRPSERKQILADLLKLGQYDELAERAKERSRQLKAQVDVLERNLAAIEAQLQNGATIAQEKADLETTLAQMHQQQTEASEQLQTLQTIQHQRQTWQQQLTWQQQQQRSLNQDCQRLQQELVSAQQQLHRLDELLQQGETIVAGYTQWQQLQKQEESQSAKFQAYQQTQTQRQHYQQQQTQLVHELQTKLQQSQAQLEVLTQQEQDIQHTLSKTADIEAALAQLQQARADLHRFEELQAKVAPLLQRRQQLQGQIDRHFARLSARLEELQASARQLQTQQERQPLLQQAVLEVADQIEEFEKRKTYLQRVREKGLERRSFMERLQENQREYERQLGELNQKVLLLKQGVEHSIESIPQTAEVNGQEELLSTASAVLNSTFPPCPLCDRPLDEHHWHLVLEKHQTKQQEILDQIWVIREQLATSEREIQVLRQEYRNLDQSLALYGAALERRGQLQEQIQTTQDFQQTLQKITTEANQLAQTIQTGNYATDLQEELRFLDRSLQELNYDEKDHALAKGLVDRWRWAEIKQVEIKQAQRQQTQITERRPALQSQISELHTQLEALQTEVANGLAIYDRQLADIGYSSDQHNRLRVALRQAQPWQLRYQELHQAQQQYPQMQQRVSQLSQALQERQQALNEVIAHVETITHQLSQTPDGTEAMRSLEQQIQSRRQQLDAHIIHVGRLEQQQQQHAVLSTQHTALNTELQSARLNYRIHQELAQAFGKNGIQALMIENVLPQLEAETNRILGRLSNNQLHIQFITQRASKVKGKAPKNQPVSHKLIDTLDIAIADAKGTRPYETYSGGEAFRVNFAIRLALARLLAQRSGTALQMLIIDEGFGTQDQEGCDRLVAAINAIAADFACILTITHMPHFKEAFQSRIEVCKTENGSQLTLAT
jgi:DNA repair protein SbcC/Rad50